MTGVFFDVLRYVDLVLGISCLFTLARFYFKKWKGVYTEKEKRAWTSYFIISLWVIEGSIETIAWGIPGGPRHFLGTLAMISIFWVLHTPDDRQQIYIESNDQER